MRENVIYVAGVVVLLVAIVLVLALRQPAGFRIERTARIAAPASEVFAEVNDFHEWQKWSPYVELDPNMTTTYGGPEEGTGSSMAWAGNAKAGEGKMTILESRPSELVGIDLQFTKPFAAKNFAEFTFMPDGDQTVVTWAMSGDRTFPFRVVSVFMNMDKMVGGDFERGLAKMKTVIEKQPRA